MLPNHRYLTVNEDISEFINKEVYVRWSVDWGDNIHWEKGLLISVEPLPLQSKKSQKGNWKALVDGKVKTFEWCAIEV